MDTTDMRALRESGPATDLAYARLALRLARHGYGRTSPNPMVGAVVVRDGRILGQGWHHAAGAPHAEIQALGAAARRGIDVRGATLYVTLEPCSTHGRTPPCTDALVAARLKRVVVCATDPNPCHAGRGYGRLRAAGIAVSHGLLSAEANALNEAFNHWIVRRIPFVAVKAAMTLDGKIATAAGLSQWITGPAARALAMRLRQGADAILVGVNTVLADDPSLTVRLAGNRTWPRPPRRIVLDSAARTPSESKLLTDAHAARTLIVTGTDPPRARVRRLEARVEVWRAPLRRGRVDLGWLLTRLGAAGITHVLVEGGGEVNASFLSQGLAQRIAFFYAPKVLGGRSARPAVAGRGASGWPQVHRLAEPRWRRVGPDLFLTARLKPG